MDSIKIIGYKSIKEATVELRPINLLIGANGSGKSNFLSFFEFINRLYDRKLQEYVALNGGASKMMHKGSKATNELSATIKFKDGVNSYSFTVKEGNDSFIFTEENLWYLNNPWQISNYGNEANVKTDGKYRSKYVRSHLSSFKKYHFHDTGKQSPFNRPSHIENDIHFSYEKGENLAAFLYYILRTNQQVYNRIINTIQSIAPYFSDFYLQPNEEGFVRLQWQDKYSSTIYGVTDLSDGTIRFIALTTLFLQPNLPATIIIDEPELGLHPFAISKLAGMIQSAASKNAQVIVATQSADLINHFHTEDILTVNQYNGESFFERLNEHDLSEWLDDYSVGDLWQRNIIHGGQPS